MSTVQHCASCGTELPAGLPRGLCPRCVLAVSEDDSDALPRDFGDFELLEEIARGGMGIVYKARQKSLGRIVALKRLLFGPHASPSFIKRFRIEASAAAALQHPNIVAIHEVGVHDDEQFLVMDYVDGPNLARLTRDNALSAKRMARYLKSIAEAVHFAHERHILHRDLKPSNILIDSNDQPRVTDFGLAKRVSADSAPATDFSQLTLSGQFIGSPGYVSPEQALGERGRVSPRSDVYSLGATLYHLLTGRPPFVGESLADTIYQVRHEEPLLPHLLNPSVSRDLETICLKCLEKEPERRYQTARELAEELNRFLEDLPIVARPIGRAERLRRWGRRNPRLAASLAALALTLIAGTAVSLWQARRANIAAQTSRAASVNAFLGQARAGRVSGLAGRRFDSLAALEQAAQIAPSLALRNEAIACLALTDVRTGRSWNGFPRHSVALGFHDGLDRYARSDSLGQISIRQTADDKELMLLKIPVPKNQPAPAAAHHVLFSPRGQYLAALHGPAGELHLWDLATQQSIALPVTNVSERAIDFSPDGKRLAVADTNGMISVFEIATREKLASFPRGRTVSALRFDPAGERLAVSSVDSLYALVFNLARQEPPRELFHGHIVRGLAWHPHENLLATSCGDQRLHLWHLATGEHRVLQGTETPLSELAFNHRGDLLVSYGNDRALRFWDHAAGQPLLRLEHADLVALNFSADDQWLAAKVDGSAIQLLEVAPPGNAVRSLARAGSGALRVRDMDLSPDGRFLALAAADGMRLYDLAADTGLEAVPTGPMESLSFHPGTGDLITRGYFGLHRFQFELDRALGPELLLVGPPFLYDLSTGAGNVSVNGNGATWAVAAEDRVLIFNQQVFSPRRELSTGPGVRAVAISPDARWVATANWQTDSVQLWETEGGLLTNAPVAGAARLAFSPDGRWLAVGTEKQCSLWRAGTWTSEAILPRSSLGGQPGPLTFSPDGRLLAFALAENVVGLLDCSNATMVAHLEPTERFVPTSLRFSRDSARLFCAGDGHPILVWDLPALRRSLAGLGLDWPGRALSSKPLSPEPAARVLYEDRSLEQAQQNLQLLRDLAVSNVASNWASRGRLNAQWGRHERAVQDFTRALELEQHPAWYYTRAFSRTWLHQFAGGIDDYEKALALNPNLVPVHKELAYIRFYCPDAAYRDNALGQRHAEEALRLEPTNRTSRAWLALAQYRAGQFDQSLKTLDGNEPGRTMTSPALLVQAMNRAALGDLPGARQSFEQARHTLAEKPNSRALYFKDRAYFRAFLDEAASAIAAGPSARQSAPAQNQHDAR